MCQIGAAYSPDRGLVDVLAKQAIDIEQMNDRIERMERERLGHDRQVQYAGRAICYLNFTGLRFILPIQATVKGAYTCCYALQGR